MYDPDFRDCQEVALILVCPSIHKECGIGRYTQQVARACATHFKSVATFETTLEAASSPECALGKVVVLFQHEYALVDFNSNLSASETTSDVISRLSGMRAVNTECYVAVVMHTIVDFESGAVACNKQFFASQLPIFSTSREGAIRAQINYVDLGVPLAEISTHAIAQQQVEPERPVGRWARKRNPFMRFWPKNGKLMRAEALKAKCKKESSPTGITIASFGFLSPNKDVGSVFQLCASTGCEIRANFASRDSSLVTRVREQALDFGVRGNVSFDFLGDEQLIDFLSQAEILYQPQHDIAHYSTSATARMGIALGQMVIVPPHRPFHDIAAGVAFADLEGAVALVNSVMKDPARLREYRKRSLEFAQQTEMSRVYTALAQRIVQGQVWCGGRIDQATLRGPSASAISPEEIGKEAFSGQNIAGWLRQGAAIVRGKMEVLEAMPLPFNMPSSSNVPLPGQPLSASVGTVISAIDTELAELGDARAVSERLEKLTSQSCLVSAVLRAVTGHPSSYVSVTELLGLPLASQAFYLHRQMQISLDKTAAYIARRSSDISRCSGSQDREVDAWLRAALLLREIVGATAGITGLVWASPLSTSPTDMRRLIFPETLLGRDIDDFVVSMYHLLLRRDPDADGYRHHFEMLKSGMSKSEMIWKVQDSPEGRDAGIQLGHNLEYWRSRESLSKQMTSIVIGLMPEKSRLISENIDFVQRTYRGRRSRVS